MRLARLAALQHGVVVRRQLLTLGLSRHAIQTRIDGGRLHPVYRGVYAVGHARLTRSGRRLAAVLACGPDAVLSHRAAVALWELRPVASGPLDVTVPGRTRRGQGGIRVHNVHSLHATDRAVLDAIPVTSLARTLLDYAEIAHRQQLRLAIEAAERRELFDRRAVDELCARTVGRAGVKRLRSVLAEIVGPVPWTRSELERRFLALIREAGVPEPSANVLVAGALVDLYWPGLVVELDSWTFHKSRERFEADRRRDARLQLAGCGVLRVTQRRIEREPRALLAELDALRRSPPRRAS
ncbi:MAG: type IV toxin-antitoxin system AbiEi family antitoxin domain-containing protein [Solirubrobacteraceae bacterium]